MPVPTVPALQNPSLVRGLGLMAATAIVIGDVIGTGVFLKARVMTCNVELPWLVVVVWVVAGLLAMAGALTYAELSAMMPRAGGEYIFIREAYGRVAGFLFGWMRFFIGNTGGMAALSFGLGIFLNVLLGNALSAWAIDLPLGGWSMHVDGIKVVAIAAMLVATIINCAAVSVGGQVASVLTSLKVAFVLGIGAIAFFFGRGDWSHFMASGAGGLCAGVPAAARGGMAGDDRGDDRGDVGLQRVERGDLCGRRGPRPRSHAATRVDRRPRHRRVPVSVRQRQLLLRAGAGRGGQRRARLDRRDRRRHACLWPGGGEPAGGGVCHVRIQRLAGGVTGLRARAVRDGAGRFVLQAAGTRVAAHQGAHPRTRRAAGMGERAGAVRIV